MKHFHQCQIDCKHIFENLRIKFLNGGRTSIFDFFNFKQFLNWLEDVPKRFLSLNFLFFQFLKLNVVKIDHHLAILVDILDKSGLPELNVLQNTTQV